MPDDRFLHKRAGHSEKVNLLTDLEYRVWTQYLLSADDFGVMRGTHHKLQADNDHLSIRPARVIQRGIVALVARGLIRRFEHQGKPYVYQHDWQSWQKVSYPRTTDNPKPPADALEKCDQNTQGLFLLHPGGAGRTRREHSQNIPETLPESSPLMRAGPPAKRLTANGQRLTAKANGSEGVQGEPPPMGVWVRELVDLYPAQARCGWNLVDRPLFEALHNSPDGPVAAWEALKARLEVNKRSHQWRVKGMIPRLDRYLRDGTHLQELPAHTSEELSPQTNRTLQAAAEILGRVK